MAHNLTALRRETGQRVSSILAQAQLEATRVSYASHPDIASLKDLLEQASEHITNFSNLSLKVAAAQRALDEQEALAGQMASILRAQRDKDAALAPSTQPPRPNGRVKVYDKSDLYFERPVYGLEALGVTTRSPTDPLAGLFPHQTNPLRQPLFSSPMDLKA